MTGRYWIAIVAAAAVVVVAVVALVVGWGGDDSREVETAASGEPSPAPGAAATPGSISRPGIEPPVTGDPVVLARWVAEVVYGMDHRDDRATYVDALWSVTLGADAGDAAAARAAFADDPALAGLVELVPDPDIWERMATHQQWAVFEVREPVGAKEIELADHLTQAGVTTTMVLVTGWQTIHYTGEDGASQTQSIQPSLQLLIGCSRDWGGCRLLRVVDRQP